MSDKPSTCSHITTSFAAKNPYQLNKNINKTAADESSKDQKIKSLKLHNISKVLIFLI